MFLHNGLERVDRLLETFILEIRQVNLQRVTKLDQCSSSSESQHEKQLTHPSQPPTQSWNPNRKNLEASVMSASISFSMSLRANATADGPMGGVRILNTSELSISVQGALSPFRRVTALYEPGSSGQVDFHEIALFLRNSIVSDCCATKGGEHTKSIYLQTLHQHSQVLTFRPQLLKVPCRLQPAHNQKCASAWLLIPSPASKIPTQSPAFVSPILNETLIFSSTSYSDLLVVIGGIVGAGVGATVGGTGAGVGANVGAADVGAFVGVIGAGVGACVGSAGVGASVGAGVVAYRVCVFRGRTKGVSEQWSGNRTVVSRWLKRTKETLVIVIPDPTYRYRLTTVLDLKGSTLGNQHVGRWIVIVACQDCNPVLRATATEARTSNTDTSRSW